MKRMIAILLMLAGMSIGARGQVLNLDMSNLSVSVEELLSREKAHVQDVANDKLAIAKQAATVENTRELLKMYNKVGSWIKTGTEITSILSRYQMTVNSMFDFSKIVANMDYRDVPQMMYYLKYGWAYVVYIEDQVKMCKTYLNKNNDMTQEFRMSMIQKIDRKIGIAQNNVNSLISAATINYCNYESIKGNIESLSREYGSK